MRSKVKEPYVSWFLVGLKAEKMCSQIKLENFHYFNFFLTKLLLAPGFTVPLTGGGFFRF